ncbi:MAG: hypothetical protein JNN05_07300 [Candidatus Omnitrophica bacterium]|nr:hypothetical protein [Candidatus Omnitrophota bacterium]
MASILAILVIFLVGGYWWMNRKPVAAYRPGREDILILLRKVYGGLNTELEWGTFVDLPIENDEKLEDVRKKCAAINENKTYYKDLRDGFMFNDQGMAEIRKLITEMENYVKSKGRDKTEFQQNCAQLLEHKMESLGFKFSSWEFKNGPDESYYQGDYKGIQVFIYADGAGVKSNSGSTMFDRQDFKSETDLTRAVVAKLTELSAVQKI